MTDKTTAATEKFREWQDRVARYGCSDHGCVYGHQGGMGTNAGCRCGTGSRTATMMMHARFAQLMRMAKDMADALEAGNGA